MNYLTKFLVLLLAVIITGCAHEPKKVEASLPLVKPTNVSEVAIPESLQDFLNIQRQGATFSFDGMTYMIENKYISALGNLCVKLNYSVNEGYPQNKIACKKADKWYQISKLEEASVSNLLIKE